MRRALDAHRAARHGARAAAHDPHRRALIGDGEDSMSGRTAERWTAIWRSRRCASPKRRRSSASRLMGRGDEKAADQAAVDAMRQALNGLAIDGTVVIGEGERDEAPMLYIGEKVGTGQGPQDRHRARSARRHDDHRQGRRQRARGASPWPRPAASSTRPTSTWTRSRSAAACGEVVDLDETPADNLQEPRQGQEGRGRRSRRLHPRPAAPRRADRQGARGRRAHHADLRRRCQRRHRDLAARERHRHLYGLGRRARGRAGGGGAALHRRPDAGPAAVPQRRRARPRAAARHHRSRPQIRAARSRQGRRHVRRHRRHRRHHAAGRAALPRRRDDPFDGDALEDRHGAHHRGAAQFQPQDPASRRSRAEPAMASGDGERGRFSASSARCTGRRWRAARGRRPRRRWRWRSGSALPEIVGRAAGGARRRAGRAPSASSARRLRELLPDPGASSRTWTAPSRASPRAVERGETIAIFGDYDVDGATSAALLQRFLAARRRRASWSISPTGSAKAMARTRRRC